MSSPAAGENRLTRIPARTRARDTRATDSVSGSCVILRNSAVVGNRPESPAGIYINPGGLEGVRVRINRFIPIPIVVRIWHLTVPHLERVWPNVMGLALARNYFILLQSLPN